MKLDRVSYVILAILQKYEAYNFIRGLTIDEIARKEKISKANTLYKKVKLLQKSGYAEEGTKVGRAKSYYITPKGKAVLQERRRKIMNKKEYRKQYGFLGIGQFGGNITRKFEMTGYPCIVANSSQEDLETLANVKNKLHFQNGKGCHKDRRQAKQLLKDNLDMLLAEIDTVMQGITTLFICASAAGGTGSGMLPAVAKIISEKIRVNVCIITVLPSKSENFQSYANTVEVFQEIEKLDSIGAVFILDNDRHTNKLKINEIFFTHLEVLLANENGSSYGCLDRSEIDKKAFLLQKRRL